MLGNPHAKSQNNLVILDGSSIFPNIRQLEPPKLFFSSDIKKIVFIKKNYLG